MILIYFCKHCKRENRIRKSAVDRFELDKKLKSKNVVCNYCNNNQELDLNKVYAKSGGYFITLLSLGIIIAVVCVYLSYNSIDFSNIIVYSFTIITIPALIFSVLQSEDNRSIKYFNRTKI